VNDVFRLLMRIDARLEELLALLAEEDEDDEPDT
jgi:hypothetical protein